MKILLFEFIFLVVVVSATTRTVVEEEDDNGNRIRLGYTRNKPLSYIVKLVIERRGEELICGGCIISKNHILTAAHCVIDVQGIDIYAGGIATYKAVKYRASRIYIHQRYVYNKGNAEPYDMAIIKTKTPIQFIPNEVGTIKLATTDLSVGRMGMIAGWGYVRDNKLAVSLQEAQVEVVDNYKCDAHLHIICVHGTPNKSACLGDSGGPLVVRSRLAGILSYTVGKCGAPAGYTSVVPYRSWIFKVMSYG